MKRDCITNSAFSQQLVAGVTGPKKALSAQERASSARFGGMKYAEIIAGLG
jgi:hypothetical protein